MNRTIRDARGRQLGVRYGRVKFGGGGEIRTHESRERLPVIKTDGSHVRGTHSHVNPIIPNCSGSTLRLCFPAFSMSVQLECNLTDAGSGDQGVTRIIRCNRPRAWSIWADQRSFRRRHSSRDSRLTAQPAH
jgi:hypothetical protein